MREIIICDLNALPASTTGVTSSTGPSASSIAALVVSARSINGVGASLESTGLTLLQAGGAINLSAPSFTAGDLTLVSSGSLTLNQAQVKAAGDLRLGAGGELLVQAGKFTADGAATLTAAADLTLSPTSSTSRVVESNTTRELTRYARTVIDAAGSVALQSTGGLIVLDGAQIESGGSIAVQGAGVAMQARKDLTKETTVNGNTTLMPTTENLVQARLLAESDVAVLASGTGVDQGKIFLTGAKIESNSGHVSLLAARDLDVAHDVTTDTTYEHFYEVKRRWFSKKITDITKTSVDETANPSDISGRSVSLGAGGTLNVIGSMVLADGAVGLHADQDLNLLSTSEASYAYESRSVRKSGLFGNGGLSITIGSKSRTDISRSQENRQASASVASIAGDVLATAGGNYLQLSSDITAPQGDIHVAAQNVTLGSNNNTRSVLNIIRERQSGLTLSASHPLVNAAQSVNEMAKIAKRTENGRYQALALMTSGLTIYNQWQSLSDQTKSLVNPLDNAAKSGWTIGGSLGTSKSDFESLTSSTTPVESAINAGRNVSLTASAAGADTGDITLAGSRVTASGNLSVNAGRDLTLAAAIGTSTETTQRTSSANAVGLSLTLGGQSSGTHLTLAASRSNGWSNGWGTTYFNSEFTAGEQLSMSSGRDTLLSGAKATGTSVLARVGTSGSGNLTVASPLDESHYRAKESSYGVNASIPIPGYSTGGSFSLSASELRLLAENESVKQQTSIVAGSGGLDIRVNGHTHLRGGAVASKSVANTFETQTLTHEDVANYDVVQGKNWSVSLSISAASAADTGSPAPAPGTSANAGGSSIGLARLDTNERFSTQSSVTGGVRITRADLQASVAERQRASERDPLVAARTQRQRELDQLLLTEPPKCDNCALEGAPVTTRTPALPTGSEVSASVAPQEGALTAPTGSQGGVAASTGTVRGTVISSEEPTVTMSAAWREWDSAVAAARADIAKLTLRIDAINAKVYQDSATLSTSASGLHQPLLHTFDRTKSTQALRDGVAVTAAFGKAAYKQAGDFAQQKYEDAVKACIANNDAKCPEADNWKDGGLYRGALHTAIGGIAYGTPGVVGNGAGTAVLAVMNDRFFDRLGISDPTVQGVLKNLAVTIAGAAAGGTAGAAAAFNADANNRQLHPLEINIIRTQAGNFARQLKGGAQPSQAEIDAAEARLAQEAFRIVQFGAPGKPDAEANTFLHQPQFRVQLPADPSQQAMGVGYAFYAMPDQRANPNMYADLIVADPAALSFYWKNGITQPRPAEVAAAIERYSRGRDNTSMLTKLASLFSGGIALAPAAPSAMVACLANIAACGIGAAEIAAGPAAGPGLGFAYLASRAGVGKVVSAAEANAAWMAIKPGNTAAWSEGTVILQGEISVGTRMRMYVTQEQADLIRDRNLTSLGGWATFDAPPTSAFQLRQSLALPQAFKPTEQGLYVVELEVTKSMPANVGFVGPQAGARGEPAKYSGGGTQIQLTDYGNRGSYLRVIGVPKCVEGC